MPSVNGLLVYVQHGCGTAEMLGGGGGGGGACTPYPPLPQVPMPNSVD